MSDQVTTVNDPEPDISLEKILETVQNGQHEAYKAHNRLVKRFEVLLEEISELGDRMGTMDQFLQSTLATLFPVDMALRITTQTQVDGTPNLSLSLFQPQTQAPPVQNRHRPAAAPLHAPSDDKYGQAAGTQPRRKSTRGKPAKENASTSTKQRSPQAEKPRVKPGYNWEDTYEKRALDPSPPRITSTRALRPRVNRPETSSAKDQSQKADESEDEVMAVIKKRRAEKNQQETAGVHKKWRSRGC